jgi:hypothetical protein
VDEATPGYVATSLVVYQSRGSTGTVSGTAARLQRGRAQAFADCAASCTLTPWPWHGVLAPVWCGQIVVLSCQLVARAFAFNWSNSAWVIVPASRSCLADAI